jgi:hypothetical protein
LGAGEADSAMPTALGRDRAPSLGIEYFDVTNRWEATSVSWRAGAKLFREMWPLIQAHVPEDQFRVEFVRDLLRFFMDCDMDGTDVRRMHPEIDRALDELGIGEG